jgi:hypothetical protein
MTVRAVAFAALLFAALALVPSGAHLAELPNKVHLSREAYLTVQQIYRGWALFGIVVIGALLSTLALTITVRRSGPPFGLAVLALACLIWTQIIFWTVTFPANRATENWTTLPSNWTDLRARWEYSHAAAAGLNLIAFVAIALAVLRPALNETTADG